ncbi:hypothetical protein LVJ83_11860 [Uruburuella testudinis]|uniref:Uncharacterized protein n=1 Tax=Uruburuella testudinis TaxID=1282863 RepID=A0ABY4DRC9_9NEIS|nr:hypothetical protein [Uruburuella testudinis]UOO81603.1 hypothetical protein LVJ83_11860 [Uruburuella testudinis]
MNYTDKLIHTTLLEQSAAHIKRATRHQLDNIQAVLQKAKAERDGAEAMLNAITSTTATACNTPQVLREAQQAVATHTERLQALQAMIEAQETFLDGLEAITGHNGSSRHEA